MAPEKYGYPASNVSGVLERTHVAQSLEFARQLLPSIKTFGHIQKKSPTGRTNSEKIQADAGIYPAKLIALELTETLKETVAKAKKLREECDVLIIGNMQGILGESNKPLSDKIVVGTLVNTFAKPTIGLIFNRIKYGALCGIIKTGQEQGRLASEMLLRAMKGTQVSQLPITYNKEGKAVINLTTMRALGIKPSIVALQKVKLVKTEE